MSINYFYLNMKSDEIAALSIGSSIIFVVFLLIAHVMLRHGGSKRFTNDNLFNVKKGILISIITIVNVFLCGVVYYTKNLQIVVYIIVALKSKDILLSLIFPFNLIWSAVRDSKKKAEGGDGTIDNNLGILAFIPTYTEPIEQIIKTVDSVTANDTKDRNLFTCVINDTESKSASALLDTILLQQKYSYVSWTKETVDCVVYYGLRNDKKLMIIDKSKNVGKKDSIILINDLFNHERDSLPQLNNELRASVKNDLSTLSVNTNFGYIFSTDADTVVEKDCIAQLVHSINKRNAVATCGVVNCKVEDTDDIMCKFWKHLQNSQYMFGQYIRRFGEDFFSQVLCLPGCVSMVRIGDEFKKATSLYSENVKASEFVKSCVQYVGTDRRYTSSIIYTNKSDVVLQRESHVYTTPPNTFHAYLKQRRRWCQNAYFNTMLNIFSPNVDIVLRFFSLIDVIRQSTVYFRMFNTLFFVYLLATTPEHTLVINILPYIVIISYPAGVFFIYAIFNSHLRKQYITLIIMHIINKVVTLLTSILIFTYMLISIGKSEW